MVKTMTMENLTTLRKKTNGIPGLEWTQHAEQRGVYMARSKSKGVIIEVGKEWINDDDLAPMITAVIKNRDIRAKREAGQL